MIRAWLNRWTRGEDRAQRRAPDDHAPLPLDPGDLDPATGLIRWEKFVELLEIERQHTPGVLLVIDLGTHPSGLRRHSIEASDAVPWLAQAIRQAIRSDDLLAHVSGNRFAVLLRDAPQELAETISLRIHEAVDETLFMTASGVARLHVAIGGALYDEAAQTNVVAMAMQNLADAQNTSAAAILR